MVRCSWCFISRHTKRKINFRERLTENYLQGFCVSVLFLSYFDLTNIQQNQNALITPNPSILICWELWESAVLNACLHKQRTRDDYHIPRHYFFPHSSISLSPCPPSRRGHTCLCVLLEPVYPVQMLLLFFSQSHPSVTTMPRIYHRHHHHHHHHHIPAPSGLHFKVT